MSGVRARDPQGTDPPERSTGTERRTVEEVRYLEESGKSDHLFMVLDRPLSVSKG